MPAARASDVDQSAEPRPAGKGDGIVLGPLLRRVEGTAATIWVETSRPGTVEVRAGDAGGAAKTFTAHGHHFGFVHVRGLPADAFTPYEVRLDGVTVWPPPGYGYPRPAIRTRSARAPVRILFGSCRESSPLHTDRFPPDALDAYAVRLADRVRTDDATAAWPDLIMLLGDQVYADETSTTMREYLRRPGRRPDAPRSQVVDFHEYTQLYLDSWTDPDIRWLLSTVPSVMVFDDHEIIDDWNISASWRTDIARRPWWATRISAGLSSYWVYQHLGNLAPDMIAADPVYAAVTSVDDASEVLDAFGARADREPASYRWSYALDVGSTRVVVLDNRAARRLTPGNRAMLPSAEFTWLTGQVAVDGGHDARPDRPGGFDHLVIGSSLPWLMPPAIHHLEAASERLCESPRRVVAAFAEKARRRLDLEHWAAFSASFDALTRLIVEVAERRDGPATVSVVSGDVHHSYVARADLAARTPVYQLTCSPVHNQLPAMMKPAMRFGWSRVAAAVGRWIARVVGLPSPIVTWHRLAGPVYRNALAELVHNGGAATLRIEATRPDKRLTAAVEIALAPGGDQAST